MTKKNYLGKNYDGHILMLGVDKAGNVIQTPYPSKSVNYTPLELTKKLQEYGVKTLSQEEVKTFFKQTGKAINEK